ncbi:MAG: DUF4292 domain-containing protein [Planctomycetota bacterium]
MPDRFFRPVMLTALLAALLAGCASKGRPKEVPYVNRGEIVSKLNADARALSEFRASLSIYADVKAWKRRGTVSALLAIAPEDRMRLKLSVLGKNFLDVTSTGGRLYLLEPEEKRLRVAALDELASSDSFLGPDTFRAAFLTEPLPPRFLLKKLPQHYVIVVYSDRDVEGGVVRELYVDRADLTVSRLVAYDSRGLVLMEATYDRYRDIAGVMVPTRIDITWPGESALMKVKVENITLGIPEANRKALFSPPAAAGLTVEPLVQKDASSP